MKNFLIAFLLLFSAHKAVSQGFLEQLHLLSYPVDSFKLEVHTTFLQDINTTYPPHLNGYNLFQENDTVKLQLYYLIPSVIVQTFGVTVINNIKLGKFTASSGVNYVKIYPYTVDTLVDDTTAFAKPDTTLPFPWITAVPRITSFENLQLFPNPVMDVLTVYLPLTASEGIYLSSNPVKNTVSAAFTTKQQGTMDIRVMDVNGQLLISQQQKIAATSLSVSVDHLPPGVYYLMVSDKKQRRYQGSFVKVN